MRTTLAAAVVAVIAVTAVTASAATAAPTDAGAARAVDYQEPLTPPTVLRPFDAAATRYGPGHRGVDLAAAPGTPVRTAAPGEVTFAGPVAGRGVVVVRHADGIRTTYEPVRPAVVAGQLVVAGQAVGVVAGSHDGCPDGCLHWGARRGEDYVDPLSLLRPLGPVRLLPWT